MTAHREGAAEQLVLSLLDRRSMLENGVKAKLDGSVRGVRFTAILSLIFVWSVGVAQTAWAASDIVSAARKQIGVTVVYDPAYAQLAFPGGDIVPSRGVCTDVIVRALRSAHGFDLQAEVNADMRANRSAYPKKWSATRDKTDANIDHRRVPNLMKYFERRGFSKPVAKGVAQYQAGDIVAWNLGRGLTHIGIVSDKVSASGTPLIIHNINRGAREEDMINDYEIIGHYRLPAKLTAIGSRRA
jgi:uncharacterized protein